MHTPSSLDSSDLPSLDNRGRSFTDIVARIRNNDPSGREDLFALLNRGIRFYFARRVPSQEIEDRLHDLFMIVFAAIRNGNLRDPERLAGFIRVIAQRQVAAYIGTAVQRRNETSIDHDHHDQSIVFVDSGKTPEQIALEQEQTDLAVKILAGMNSREQEVLRRFYLLEQDPATIQAEMGLTETQFRLLKCRAKGRFAELGRRKMVRKQGLSSLLLKASA